VFDAATKINGFTLNNFLLTGPNLLKNFNATKHEDEFPKAAAAIVDQHYVDDYLGCAESVEEVVELKSNVIEIQSRGGFEIRGFMTSSYDVIKQIPEKLVNGEDYMLLNKNQTAHRVLGLQWQCRTDCFTFSLNFVKLDPDIISGRKNPTEREVLRFIMSVYDPLGFLSPIIIKVKIIMQRMWRSGIGLDDELPPEVNKKRRVSQYLIDQFWRRWTKEYLPTLVTQRKWNESIENLNIGDLVLVKDINTEEETGQWV
jgi:hypothetical protein